MSTERAPWTTVSILGITTNGDDQALGRAVLRAAQDLTPQGMRLDLFDLYAQGETPDAAESLRHALVERDALLAVVSATNGGTSQRGIDALTALFQPLDRSAAIGPRHRVPIALLRVGDDGDAVIEQLRRTLRDGRACLMPTYHLALDSDPETPGEEAAGIDPEAQQVLEKLLDDMRAWATELGCASVLSDE